jgi:hypothetical protein
MYCRFPYWFGREKAFLLAAYVLLFVPACVVLWGYCTGYPGPRAAGLPALTSHRFLASVFAGALISYGIAFNRGVELSDESVYRFEARALKQGRLTIEDAPETVLSNEHGAQAFRFTHELHFKGRWFGKYPPGYPFVLALADRLGLDRSLNAILSVSVICLTGWLACDVFCNVVAQWAIVALSCSAFFFFNSLGWYSHNLSGLLIVTATAACVRSVKSHPVLFLVIASIAMDLCLFVRPFTAAISSVPLIAYAVARHAKRPRTLGKAAAIAASVTVTAVAGYLYIQQQLTGSWLTSPYSLYYRAGAVPKEINLTPASMLRNVITITTPELADTMLSAFPLVIPLSLIGAVIWVRRTDERRWNTIFLFSVFWSLVLGYVVQTEAATSSIGNRYYYEGYFGAVIVAVAAAHELLKRCAAAPRVLWSLGACLLCAALMQFFVYQRIFADSRTPYASIENAARRIGGSTRLVYLADRPPYFWGSWMDLNGPDWRTAPVLYLHDPGPAGRDAVARLLGRHQWTLLQWDEKKRAVSQTASTD